MAQEARVRLAGTMSISSTAAKADLLRSLHVPGDPLVPARHWL